MMSEGGRVSSPPKNAEPRVFRSKPSELVHRRDQECGRVQEEVFVHHRDRQSIVEVTVNARTEETKVRVSRIDAVGGIVVFPSSGMSSVPHQGQRSIWKGVIWTRILSRSGKPVLGRLKLVRRRLVAHPEADRDSLIAELLLCCWRIHSAAQIRPPARWNCCEVSSRKV